MGRRARSTVHGVLVVDKPKGPTSHDVVRLVRRAFRTRAVGHAGTLDPMATGVLVIAIGQATKLVRWLTAADKRYCAVLQLGAETDTLDAEGQVVERADWRHVQLEPAQQVARQFVGTYDQVPPMFSAIRVQGQRLHELARRGETVQIPVREVTASRLELTGLDQGKLSFEVDSAKGFYVRSLGRDLARALGTRGHLIELRRTHSGHFGLDGAVGVPELERAAEDDGVRETLTARLLGLPEACGAMPRVVLSEAQVIDARHGRRIHGAEPLEVGTEPVALLDGSGALVAIGRAMEGSLQVVRGFAARE